ncbi:MAG: hypothetical protein GXY77_20295 [Fibrobacter sp.]|nr:hypothetical protein [Fibrobacter sp.]
MNIFDRIGFHIQNNNRNINTFHKCISAIFALMRNQSLTGKTLQKTLILLKEISSDFNESGVDYWMEGGTLLGIIRENRLLPWDHDIDFSVNIDHVDLVLSCLQNLRKKGYRIEYFRYDFDIGPFKKGMPRIIKIRNTVLKYIGGDASADIFFKKNVNGKYFWTTDYTILKSTPSIFCKNTIGYTFNKHKIKIPAKYEDYLACRYGCDWRIPKKDYCRQTDDLAIV